MISITYFLFIGCTTSISLPESGTPKALKNESNPLKFPRIYRERF